MWALPLSWCTRDWGFGLVGGQRQLPPRPTQHPPCNPPPQCRDGAPTPGGGGGDCTTNL